MNCPKCNKKMVRSVINRYYNDILIEEECFICNNCYVIAGTIETAGKLQKRLKDIIKD